MKYLIILFTLSIFFSCTSNLSQTKDFRTDFSKNEKDILAVGNDIIEKTYYGSLITIDSIGQPRARVMEPFSPEKDFTIWMATNPKSRKVDQIKNNPNATMHYFDKNQMGYVSLMGKAFIVNDETIKSQKWKEEWEAFYPNQKEDYMLIKFIPETLELIGIVKSYTGNNETWAPHQVVLRE